MGTRPENQERPPIGGGDLRRTGGAQSRLEPLGLRRGLVTLIGLLAEGEVLPGRRVEVLDALLDHGASVVEGVAPPDGVHNDYSRQLGEDVGGSGLCGPLVKVGTRQGGPVLGGGVVARGAHVHVLSAPGRELLGIDPLQQGGDHRGTVG